MRRINVIPTNNFAHNLDEIEQYLIEQDEERWFQRLLDKLFNEVIPNLEEFPAMGRDFLARQPASVEGVRLYRKISARTGTAVIREYLFDCHLLLYAVKGDVLYLLSIKHHAQLSFDLAGHWRTGEGC